MIFGKVLYNNAIRGITPVWSGPTVSGKEPVNATDWADYTLFEASATGTLDYTVTTNTTIDSACLYAYNASAGSNTIKVQYESSPSVFTNLTSETFSSGILTFVSFGSVTVLSGRRVRFSITISPTLYIRQLAVGQALTFEQGAWGSVTPPTFTQGIKVTNNIGQNGSILGRSIKRLERKGKIMLDHLTDDWVRNSWEPFAKHFSRYPFFWAWDQSGHPDDVGYTYAEGVKPPKHKSAGRLSVDVPIRFLVSDSETV